jgi:hypothetical protein
VSFAREAPGLNPTARRSTMKKAYKKPALRRLGLLRQVTRFSF